MGLTDQMPQVRRLRLQFATILAIAMAPAGVLAVIQALSNLEDAGDQRLELLAADLREASQEEESTFLSIRETLRLAVRELSRASERGLSCEHTLSVMTEDDPRMTGAMVLDQNGNAVCGSAPIKVSSTTGWSDFIDRPRFVIGAPQPAGSDSPEVVAAYYPMPERRPEAFAIAVGIDLTFLRGLAASDLTPRPFALIGRDGAILATGGVDGTGWLPDDRKQLQTFLRGSLVARSQDGVERRFFVAPLISGQVWAVAAARELTFVDFIWTSQGLLVVAPILLWLIAVGAAAVTIDRLVTRHVLYLSRIAQRLGRGELDTEIAVLEGAPSEIKRLGDAIRVMARNLSERDATLQEMVSTQKSLLLEVHHRVKNNLQMISSLMNMQLRRSANPAEHRSLKLVQERIHGLALVHQSLYATERLDSIPLDHFLRDLCEHLEASLKPARAIVDLETRLDHVIVGTEVATPLALFMTEAISNIYKHAVRPGARISVAVLLENLGEDFRLTVENDIDAVAEVGPPEEAKPLGHSTSLGARLMDGFAKQIGGVIERTQSERRYRVVLTAHSGPRHGPFKLRGNRKAAE